MKVKFDESLTTNENLVRFGITKSLEARHGRFELFAQDGSSLGYHNCFEANDLLKLLSNDESETPNVSN